MKDSSCRDPKMEAYYKNCMASSSITLHADIMRPPTNSQKLHPIEPRFHLTSSQGISMNLLSTPGRLKGPTVHCPTPPPRQKPPRPELTSCRQKARPYKPTLSPTGALRTSTVSFEGSSPWIRLRLDKSLAGPRPL
jgi:hypothetical protein